MLKEFDGILAPTLSSAARPMERIQTSEYSRPERDLSGSRIAAGKEMSTGKVLD